MAIQFIQTENFLGLLFIEMISQGKSSISIKDYDIIESKVDADLSSVVVMLCSSMNELYDIASEYSDLFNVDEVEIRLSDKAMVEFNDISKRKGLIEKLESKFKGKLTDGASRVIENSLKEVSFR